MDRPDPPNADEPLPLPPDPPSDELPLADDELLTEPAPRGLQGAQVPCTTPVAATPTTAETTSPAHHPADHASAYRLLANLGVAFVSLFLFVRVFAVEPFGVPTGSMAPALIGNHREGPCPRCGHPVRLGAPSSGTSATEHYSHAACPNCQAEFSLASAIDLSGDRLLVDKNVFSLRSPRRWEMAVFHCPDTDPKEYRKPYVKRVIGLPGETISIIDGEVFANGELLRKGLAELRETRVLVFDMNYSPIPKGWNIRWLATPPENDPRLPPVSVRDPEPADSSVVNGGQLTLDAAATPQRVASVTYRHWHLDNHREEPIRAWSSYDGPARTFYQIPAVNDFSFSCEVEVLAVAGEGSFACRLFDGADGVHAEIGVGPKGNALTMLNHDGKGPLGSVTGVGLEPGKTHRVEFSFVDRRAILAIDGKVVIPPADLPPAQHRGEVRRPLQLGARGCRLLVRDLKLYRDTYYTQFGENGTQPPHGHLVTLPSNEYFMMGDNSGNSQDSRKWPTPGVPEPEFIGKPFLIHQPLRPARMTLGGRERVFQTLDWSRLRWLH